MREDFNADNAKIDAALAALNQPRSSFIKIKEISNTTGTSSIKLDLSDLDWASWQVVRIDISLFSTSTSTATIYINDSDGYYYPISGNGNERGLAHATVATGKSNPLPTNIFLFPMGSPETYVRGVVFDDDYLSYCYSVTTAYSSMTHIAISSPVSLNTRCKVQVWGIQ